VGVKVELPALVGVSVGVMVEVFVAVVVVEAVLVIVGVGVGVPKELIGFTGVTGRRQAIGNNAKVSSETKVKIKRFIASPGVIKSELN
jgi:hypothetical protein